MNRLVVAMIFLAPGVILGRMAVEEHGVPGGIAEPGHVTLKPVPSHEQKCTTTADCTLGYCAKLVGGKQVCVTGGDQYPVLYRD